MEEGLDKGLLILPSGSSQARETPSCPFWLIQCSSLRKKKVKNHKTIKGSFMITDQENHHLFNNHVSNKLFTTPFEENKHGLLIKIFILIKSG